MNRWIGWTATLAHGLVIEERARMGMDRACRDARELETGGILIGHYSADLSIAIVQEATLPPSDSRRGRSWFSRGVADLRETLRRRWQSADRTYYLGEWHYHPISQIVPSVEDFTQMANIARAEEYKCSEPLLVIVGGELSERERGLRAFVCPDDSKPMEFVRVDTEKSVRPKSAPRTESGEK